VAALVLTAPVMSAFATDGYFSHGYGMKAKGMGGAAAASTDNAFAGANNPATAAFAGNRMEAGVDLFMPKRSFNRDGTALTPGGPGTNVTTSSVSESNSFLIPEFGYNKSIDSQSAWGLTVYGNGGMNTDYPATANPNAFGVVGKLGVDLTQLIIAPTYATKLSESSSFGVSPLFVYQQFKADGLSGFAGYSNDHANLSNVGRDSSTGVGVRLGYLNKVSNDLTLGVSYSPKTKMSKFGKYAGLFAESGGFDIPENLTVGLAYQASSKVSVSADYQQIKYAGVAAIGNASSNLFGCPAAQAGGNDPQSCLGGVNGPGFGWSNVDVVKLGVQWQATPLWILRAGYNQSTNPVSSADVTFNILAPGVVKRHYTLGGTYTLNSTQDLTFAYMYAPENEVSGSYLLRGPNETAIDKVRMKQQSLGIQFGWKF
jgi:long-chain fatty acid transport protein